MYTQTGATNKSNKWLHKQGAAQTRATKGRTNRSNNLATKGRTNKSNKGPHKQEQQRAAQKGPHKQEQRRAAQTGATI